MSINSKTLKLISSSVAASLINFWNYILKCISKCIFMNNQNTPTDINFIIKSSNTKISSTLNDNIYISKHILVVHKNC